MFPEKEIDNFIKNLFAKEKAGAHAYDHTKRVYNIALRIAESTEADIKILGAAALLHDIGRPQERETGLSHSIVSGELSIPLLTKLHYNECEIDAVVDAIRTHRFSEGLTPGSIEGKILSDADKLDALGAIGVFRAIAHAVENEGGVERFLSHADEKLLKLKDLMYTDHGRKLARKRHTVLKNFVDELRVELSEDVHS